jgi:glycosyltransferase involved in cell wall biosynthesis
MHKPERVLVLITQLNRGGAETMAMNYYRHFDRSRVQYDFLVNRAEEGAYDTEIRDLGGKIFRMCPMYPQYFRRYKREFRDFLRSHPEYRIIHSNLEERSYLPLRVAAEEKIPVRIAHAHNEYLTHDFKTLVRDYFRHHLSPYITQGFACSQSAGRWLFGEDMMTSGEVEIVQNAIDLHKYSYSSSLRQQERAELGIKGDELVVGSVGRLSPQKNQSFLLKVFAETKRLRPQSVLLLVGEGELKRTLRQEAADLGIAESVRFVGSVPNVWDYLQAMDIFIFPSLYEGLGMSLIEAQATGLPCYASDTIPGEADVTGLVTYLSLEKNAKYWAKKIVMDQKPDRSLSYAEKLKASNFDISTEAKKLQDFYLNSLPHN